MKPAPVVVFGINISCATTATATIKVAPIFLCRGHNKMQWKVIHQNEKGGYWHNHWKVDSTQLVEQLVASIQHCFNNMKAQTSDVPNYFRPPLDHANSQDIHHH